MHARQQSSQMASDILSFDLGNTWNHGPPASPR